MSQAANGDSVHIHYTGRLDDGSVFDSSAGREPLQFVVGGGQVIPGFDEAVRGMAVGAEKTTTIPAGEAYGPRSEELLAEVSLGDLPEGMEVELGQELQVSDEEGNTQIVKVIEVKSDSIVLDANHHLAGENLTFDITLVKID